MDISPGGISRLVRDIREGVCQKSYIELGMILGELAADRDRVVSLDIYYRELCEELMALRYGPRILARIA